jgi:hypothetical protein
MHRRSRVFVRVLVPLLAAAVVPVIGSTPAHAAYAPPTDLGTLLGGTSTAWAINSSETIVGASDGFPVVWINRRISQLPLPPGYVGGTARDINDNWTAVGHVWDAAGRIRAARWDGFWTVRLLDQGIAGNNGAYGVNRSAVIAGFANFGFGNDPVTYTSGGTQRVNPVNQGGTGYTVNQSGTRVVVGNYVVNGGQQPFENGFSPPTAGGYMTLPALKCSFCGGAAWAVSGDGTKIFGNSTAANNETHPTKWTLGFTSGGWPTWTATDLSSPGLGNAWINDTIQDGTIAAGGGVDPNGNLTAFAWEDQRGITFLSNPTGASFGCGSRSANGINESTEIVGVACAVDGHSHAMLWNH